MTTIDFELKIDEVIKRLKRSKESTEAYQQFVKDNPGYVDKRDREFIYEVFRCKDYTFHYIKEKDLRKYWFDCMPVIILGAF